MVTRLPLGHMGDRLQQARGQCAATLELRRSGTEGERKHQKQVADLRQRRIPFPFRAY